MISVTHIGKLQFSDREPLAERGDEMLILHAAKSETFSNRWKLRVIKVFSGSAWVVGRPLRVSWTAA